MLKAITNKHKFIRKVASFSVQSCGGERAGLKPMIQFIESKIHCTVKIQCWSAGKIKTTEKKDEIKLVSSH